MCQNDEIFSLQNLKEDKLLSLDKNFRIQSFQNGHVTERTDWSRICPEAKPMFFERKCEWSGFVDDKRDRIQKGLKKERCGTTKIRSHSKISKILKN